MIKDGINRWLLIGLLGTMFLPMMVHAYEAQPSVPMSDAEVRQLLINEYLSHNTQGECPCPFSNSKSGTLCGADSKYIKYSKVINFPRPKCYPGDITDAEVQNYRIQYNIPSSATPKPAPKPEKVDTFN